MYVRRSLLVFLVGMYVCVQVVGDPSTAPNGAGAVCEAISDGNTYIHTYILSYFHLFTYILIHTYIHAYIYIYTHTILFFNPTYFITCNVRFAYS